MQKSILFLFALALVGACHKDPTVAPIYSGNNIQLSKMAVGQKSYYLRLAGEGFRDEAPYSFSYLPDTLVAEIIAENAGVFTIKEYLTPGSASIVTPDKIDGIPGGSGEYVYKLKVDKGQLQLVELVSGQWQPRLFGKTTVVLPLADIQTNEIKISGWMPGGNVTVDQGFVLSFQLSETTFDRLNFVRDYADMAFDGTGFFYLYSEQAGIVRAGYVSSWGLPGMAWDLLEKAE